MKGSSTYCLIMSLLFAPVLMLDFVVDIVREGSAVKYLSHDDIILILRVVVGMIYVVVTLFLLEQHKRLSVSDNGTTVQKEKDG